MTNDPQATAGWERRLARLAQRIDDVAATQHDLQAQIDALTTTVEQWARATDSDASAPVDGAPRPLGPPATQQGRPWLRPVSRLARFGVRATLGAARRAWDMAHPRPPWRDRVEVENVGPADRLPTVAIVVDVDRGDGLGRPETSRPERGGTPPALQRPGKIHPPERGDTSTTGESAASGARETSLLDELERTIALQTDADVTLVAWSRVGSSLHVHSDSSLGASVTSPTSPDALEAEYLWLLTPAQTLGMVSTAVEMVRLSLACYQPRFLRLDDTVRSMCGNGPPTLVIQRSLWHAEHGIDLEALRALADRDDTGVVGRDGGGRDSASEAVMHGHPFRDASGPILRLVGPWWVPARTAPRTHQHTIHSPPPQVPPLSGDALAPGAMSDERPTVMVVLGVPLLGGCEQQLADLLDSAGTDARIILVQQSPGGALAEARWQLLAARAEHGYRLSPALSAEAHGPALARWIQRWQVHRVVVMGHDRWADTLAPYWTHEAGQPAVVYLPWDAKPAQATTIKNQAPIEPVDKPERDATPGDVPPGSALPGDDGTVDLEMGARLRASLGIASDAVVVSFSADHIATERPEDFIMLADRLRDDHRLVFLVAGRGPLRARVDDLASLLPPSRLYNVPRGTTTHAVLAACDVMCSTAETRPLLAPLRRAVAASRPVVATQAGDVANLLDDGPCGLVVPTGDIGALADAVGRMVDPAVRAAYASAGPTAAARARPSAPISAWRAVLGLSS